MNYEKMCKGFKLEVPEEYNFGFDVVDKWAEDRTKLALVWVDENGENPKHFTFWDMKVLSNKFANVLKKNSLKKGDRVLLMLPNIPEWHIATLAMIKLGIILMPVTPLLSPEKIKEKVSQAKPKAIITDFENMAKGNEVRDNYSWLKTLIVVGMSQKKIIARAGEISIRGVMTETDGWLDYEYEMETASSFLENTAKTRSDDIMLLFFTSGTTGKPKMVIHEHSYAKAHLVTAKFWHDSRPTDLRWTWTDTGWAKYAWGNIFGQWIIGAAVFIYNRTGRFNLELVLKMLQDYGITNFCAPPQVFQLMNVFEDLEKYDLSGLRHCTAAGDILDSGTIKTFKERTGLHIYDGYGQTETVNLLANFPNMPTKAGSIGRPTPGYHISIIDENGNELPSGQEGYIGVKVKPARPIGILREYWKAPEEMKKAFVGDYYNTSDRGLMDKDGYVFFRGRTGRTFKSFDYRIGNFEVESPLLKHPAVAEAAVVPTPQPANPHNNLIKAIIVLAPGYEGSEELFQELRVHVEKLAAKYMRPHAVEYVKELPRTESVKVKWEELARKEFEKFVAKANLSEDEIKELKEERGLK